MPSQNLNVALLPLDIRLGEREMNLQIVESRIKSLPEGIDLVVLPELFTSGFGEIKGGVQAVAETDDGPTIRRICRISEERGLAICGGFIGVKDRTYFNRCFFIADGKPLGFYNKRHLFAGAESRIFKAGCEMPPIIEFRSWRLRPMICFDLRFPVWNRISENNFDAMILIANWPNSRYYAWKHLIIARAIENQIYVAACNREGEDVYGQYGRGDSLIVNAYGYPVGTTLEDGTEIGVFDFEKFNNDRKSMQPGRVADRFTIEGLLSEEEQA